TTTVWQSIARRGEGQYFAIAQNGGVPVVATPYDEKLAKLGAKMGTTYTAFGGGAGGSGVAFRKAASLKNSSMVANVGVASAFVTPRVSPPSGSGGGGFGGGAGAGGGRSGMGAEAASAPIYSAAAAGRAVNKALNSRAYDDSDLLTAIENGSIQLGKVKPQDLPDDLRKLSPTARKTAVEKRLAERKKLRTEILALSKKRDAFQRSEREKTAKGIGTGFDAAVTDALKTQAKRRGIGL
ncbi:MAG: hypothetical protein H7145_23725, partial [Akkermansiaceae bacterium]|nr:hypothetical protein [Armatimonadota bacterium]